jgi:hypothetical protein
MKSGSEELVYLLMYFALGIFVGIMISSVLHRIEVLKFSWEHDGPYVVKELKAGPDNPDPQG